MPPNLTVQLVTVPVGDTNGYPRRLALTRCGQVCQVSLAVGYRNRAFSAELHAADA